MSGAVALLAAAGLCALALWWASTGLLLYLDRLPARTFPRSMGWGTAVLVVSLVALWWVRGQATAPGAFVGFVAALGAWGWQELSFYTGYVTGPRRRSCDPGCAGIRHFGHALGASLYHEIAIVLTFGVIAALTMGAANTTGLWVFVTLWVMHESARINVLLGVPNVPTEVLPDHLRYLAGFCRNRPFNPLMPLSLVGGIAATAWAAASAGWGGATAYETAFWGLVTATLAIGVLEHIFLLLPFRVERLWSWFSPPAGSGGERSSGERGDPSGRRVSRRAKAARPPAARSSAPAAGTGAGT